MSEPYRLITYIFTNNIAGNTAVMIEQRFAFESDRAECKAKLRAKFITAQFVEFDDTV